jgi:Electron transfer DM13
MNKKLLISISTIAIICSAALSVFIWYSNSLAQSKKEGEKIVSRAIPSSNAKLPSTNSLQVPKVGEFTSQSNLAIFSKLSEKLLKSGQFVSLDPAHYAKGYANIIESGENIRVTFSDDFETNPDGPDLYVWLVPKQEINNIAFGGVKSNVGDYLDLGPIQSKSGSQAYQVTKAEFAANDYAVVIWCRAFGIQFSNAILK